MDPEKRAMRQSAGNTFLSFFHLNPIPNHPSFLIPPLTLLTTTADMAHRMDIPDTPRLSADTPRGGGETPHHMGSETPLHGGETPDGRRTPGYADEVHSRSHHTPSHHIPSHRTSSDQNYH